MASTIVGEKREGSGSVKKGSGDTLTFASTYHFLVVTEDKFTSREQVLLNTPGLPFVGVMYGDIQAVCTGIDAVRQKENPIYWDVTCTFDTGSESQRRDPEDPESNDPTTWIPVFVVDSFETKDKVLKYDYSTPPKKCTNSAGTEFSEPIAVTDSLCSFAFTQFENASLTLKQIMKRNGSVNKTDFVSGGETFEARTLKLNVMKAEEGLFVGIAAWRIEYRCTYDPDTWDEVRLDVGPRDIDGNECMSKPPDRAFRIVGNLDGTGHQTYSDPATITLRGKRQLEFKDFIRTA